MDLSGQLEVTSGLSGTILVSMNMNFFDSEIHFVSQISQSRGISQKWLCIQYLRMDLSFQQKQIVYKSVSWFLRYEAKRKVIIFFGTPCTRYEHLRFEHLRYEHLS